MLELKLAETFKNRFAERDTSFQRAMQRVFEEMSCRGILPSSITAERIQEVVQEEMKTSGDESLRVVKDVYPVYGRNAKAAAVKVACQEMLRQRLNEIEIYKTMRLRQMLGDVANAQLLLAINSNDLMSRVETEFLLQADKYFYEMEQARGKNLKERIVNALYDRVVIAAIVIVMAVVAAIGGLINLVHTLKALKG